MAVLTGHSRSDDLTTNAGKYTLKVIAASSGISDVLPHIAAWPANATKRLIDTNDTINGDPIMEYDIIPAGANMGPNLTYFNHNTIWHDPNYQRSVSCGTCPTIRVQWDHEVEMICSKCRIRPRQCLFREHHLSTVGTHGSRRTLLAEILVLRQAVQTIVFWQAPKNSRNGGTFTETTL